MANIEMTIESIRVGLMNPKLTLNNSQYVVMLKEKTAERYLPIFIGPAEANAIAIKMRGESMPRPLTHEFTCSIIRELKAHVKSAVINKLMNDTFYAEIIIESNNNEYKIDCRPSDALATAIYARVPIYADEAVLKKAGILLDEIQEAEEKPTSMYIFSDSTQFILSQAENEAKNMSYDTIVTGHLLLVLVKVTSKAADILRNLGVNIVDIQTKIRKLLAQKSNTEGEEPGLSPAVKETITLAIEEAKNLRSQVQPEHILIGLVRQKGGIAANLLESQGINLEKIYIELIKLCMQY